MANVRYPFRGIDRSRIIAAADHILDVWRSYTHEAVSIIAHDGQPHNTITPISRKRVWSIRIGLALRCNITSERTSNGCIPSSCPVASY